MIRRVRRLLIATIAVAAVAGAGVFGFRFHRSEKAEARVSAEAAGMEKSSFRDVFAEASDAARKNARAEALSRAAVAETLAATDAERAEVENLRGVLEFQAGQNPEALSRLFKAISLDPGNPAFYRNCAEALRVQKLPDLAVPVMRRALALDRSDFLLKVKWSLLLIEAGEERQVATAINQLAAQGTLTAEWGFAKVILLEKEGKASEARTLLRELKDKLPEEAFVECMKDVMLAPFKQVSLAQSVAP